jgi:conjugative transposon protein traQ
MPVQKDLRRGETAEIRCSLKRAGRFAGARYTLRYFQSEGKGMLRLDKGAALKPNDRYPLVREEFRLYYTSQSADRQTIDVYIEDNFGKVQQLSFAFNNKKAE